MKKKLATLMLVSIIFSCSGCGLNSCNVHNAIGEDSSKAISWFSDTGITVKNYNDRIYHIVKDNNGWLYYAPSADSGTLQPVIDANGNMTKDISIFDE